MQSETQQYDIKARAKEQRQQSLCSDKMVSSPGAIAEPVVWSKYAKSCLCIESRFLKTSHISLRTRDLSVSVRVCCLKSYPSKMHTVYNFALILHEVHFFFTTSTHNSFTFTPPLTFFLWFQMNKQIMHLMLNKKKKYYYYWLKNELTLTHVFCGHIVHTVCYLFILSPTSQTGATFWASRLLHLTKPITYDWFCFVPCHVLAVSCGKLLPCL